MSLFNFSTHIKNSLNFKERFNRYYPTEEVNDFYTPSSLSERLRYYTYWSMQWTQYIFFHLVEIFIGGITGFIPTQVDMTEKNPLFLGIITSLLMSIAWGLGNIQNILTKIFYYPLYRAESDIPHFPLLSLFITLLSFRKPSSYESWKAKTILLAILMAIPQLFLELLTATFVCLLYAGFAIDRMLKWISPIVSCVIAMLTGLIIAMPILSLIRFMMPRDVAKKQSIQQEKQATKFKNDLEFQLKNNSHPGLYYPISDKENSTRLMLTMFSVEKEHKEITELTLSSGDRLPNEPLPVVNDTIAEQLANDSELLKQLNVLNVSNNFITEKGVLLLLATIIKLSKENQTKIVLNLNNNRTISQQGIEKIAQYCLDNKKWIECIATIQERQQPEKPAIILEFPEIRYEPKWVYPEKGLTHQMVV